MEIIFFLVSLLASIVGAICGIGGGVIIKPVLDFVGVASVSTISFLSGCTVLSMSCYSVGRSVVSGESKVDFKIMTPLAIGAAVGGVVGKILYTYLKGLAADPDKVGGIQAICLLILTLGTLIYTIFQHKIKTKQIKNIFVCVLAGLFLGILSSFLGIGGGPFNLVILYYLFSMETKVAAENSLYIILISQITSLITTFVTRSVPDFRWILLILMVAGGILGGILGRKINKKIASRTVEKLFMGLMVVIIGICIYNAVRFLK